MDEVRIGADDVAVAVIKRMAGGRDIGVACVPGESCRGQLPQGVPGLDRDVVTWWLCRELGDNGTIGQRQPVEIVAVVCVC